MSDRKLSILASLGVSLLWTPVIAHFLHRWRVRRHPLSLAICVMVLLMGYLNFAVLTALMGSAPWGYIRWGSLTAQALTLAVFYVSFWLGRHRDFD